MNETNRYYLFLMKIFTFWYKSKPFFLVVNFKLMVFPLLLQQISHSQKFLEVTCKLNDCDFGWVIKSRIYLLWISSILDCWIPSATSGHIVLVTREYVEYYHIRISTAMSFLVPEKRRIILSLQGFISIKGFLSPRPTLLVKQWTEQ